MKKLLFIITLFLIVMLLPDSLSAAGSATGFLSKAGSAVISGITNKFEEKLSNPADSGTIKLISPAGGELWPAGTYQNVTWESQNVNYVAISYSQDNGITWTVITSATPAFHGSYLWAVPAAAPTQYLIKIADSVNDSLNVVSGVFSVYGPPAASTNSATDVTSNSATFNGLVNPNNSVASVKFEYGTSTSYGDTITAAQNPVSGNSDASVNAPVTGLLEGTTYHYRVRAENGAGTSFGSDRTFTTDKPDLILTSPSGGEQWQSGTPYDIKWNSKNVKNVRISYSPDDGTTWITVTSGTSASAGKYSWTVPDNLSSTYRIRISDAANSSLTAVSNTFSVYSFPSAQTNAPSDVKVSSATLRATVSAGNSAAAVSFEYGTTTSYGTPVNASPGSVSGLNPTDVTASLEGLSQGTTYHYRVKVINSAGTVYGQDRTFTTEAISISLTSPSGGERWLSGSTHSIVWSSRNVADALLAYSTDGGSSWISINNGSPVPSGGSYSWQVPDVLSSGYRIRVSDASNSSISSVSNSFSVYSAPLAKTDNATDVTVNSAVLNATVNAGNLLTSVTFEFGTTTGYGSIVSSSQSPINGTEQASLSASVSGLKAATVYHFRVKAVNEAGTSYGDDMTFIADSINLALSSPKGGEEWLAGSDKNITWTGRNINFIMISYSIDGGISWITLDNAAPAGSGSYAWKVPDSLSSQYRIRIIDAGNVLLSSTSGSFSVYSAPKAITTPPSNVTVNSAIIRGNVSAGNSPTTVTFEYGLTDSYGQTVNSQQNPVRGTSSVYVSAELAGLLPSTTYHYRVVASNKAGIIKGEDAVFTTDSVRLAISSPAGGETWKAGSVKDITWTLKNVAVLKIEYSTDDGISWITAAASTPAFSGRFAWTVPNIISSKYRIRISNALDSLLSITSKSFSVYSLPLAVTNEASNITLNSAVLYASVNPGNSLSTLTFEYGTSTAYGLTTPALPNTLSGTMPVDVSAAINGLSQGNTYHFRIKAQNSAGEVYGDDKTFTTDGITLSLTSPTGSEQWLSGSTQNISWRSKNVASIKIEYSTDNGSTWITIAQQVATSQRNYAWIVPSQVSSKYRVRITDASNASLNATSNSFLVFSMPAAQTKKATDITLSSATLRGTVNAGNAPTLVSFEYGTTVSYGMVVNSSPDLATGTADTDVSAEVSGLTAGTTYHYRLKAVNLAGTTYGSDSTFTVLSPAIKLISPTGGEEIVGSLQYTITWTSSNVSRISIDYTTDNGSSWQPIASDIPASQGSYVWNVPNNITSSSCMIRIRDKNSQTFDTVDRVFKITTYAQSIAFAGKAFAFTSVQQSGYRMISLPGESSLLKLSQFASGQAKKDWTMYYDNGKDANYFVEYDGSTAFNFGPGKGFWVLSRNTISITGEVKTVTLSSDGTYSIKLDHAGWNIISSPFDIAIPWSGVQALNSVTEKISAFNGTRFLSSDIMGLYEGYYFYNSQNLKTLKLPYRSVVQNSSLQASRLSKKDNVLSENSIALSLSDQDDVRSQVVVGLDKNSLDDYDSLDALAPPGDFEEAGMRIIDNNLSTGWKQLFTEYRNAVGEGQKFTISIKNNTERPLRLKWEGADNFKGYEIYLIDKRLSKPYDLRKETEITLPSYAKQTELDLLIGSSAFIEEENRKLMPQEFSLFQNYPNPFNPATVIKYSLPQDAFVSIRVFDMLGRVVKDVVNGFSEAGYHEVSFDGSAAASGVYYYLMEAKGPGGNTQFREAKKMLLIK